MALQRRFNRTEMSELLDIDVKTIRRWEEQGMPVFSKSAGRAGYQIDIADVVRWWRTQALEHDSVTERPSDKKSRVNAELAELDLAERRGLVVSRDHVVEVWAAAISAMRNKLRAMRRKVAPLIASGEKRIEVEKILGKLIDEALTELASDEFADGIAIGPQEGAAEGITTA